MAIVAGSGIWAVHFPGDVEISHSHGVSRTQGSALSSAWERKEKLLQSCEAELGALGTPLQLPLPGSAVTQKVRGLSGTMKDPVHP